MITNFWVVSSDSKNGNCYIVKTQDELLLFDIGVSASDLKTFMVLNKIENTHHKNPFHFDKVFISHHHQDHTLGLENFVYGKVFSFDFLISPKLNGYFFYDFSQKKSYYQQLEEYINSPYNNLQIEAKKRIKQFHLNNKSIITDYVEGLWIFKNLHTNPKNYHKVDNFSYFYDGILYITDTSLSDKLVKKVIDIKDDIDLALVEANHNQNEYYNQPIMKMNWIGWRSICQGGHLSDLEFLKLLPIIQSKNNSLVVAVHQTTRNNLKLRVAGVVVAVSGLSGVYIDKKWIVKKIR